MVATRKGVRVYSPTRENSDENSDASATSSIVPRTRSAANQEQTLDQGKATSQSSVKRCRRVSRPQNLELPSTTVGSCHEADVSDVDSSYSGVSDAETPMTRTREQRQTLMLSQEEKKASDVESCIPVVSSLKGDHSTHRRTRSSRKKIPESSDPFRTEEGDVEAESSSPVMSVSQRITRSQRRSNFARSSAKQQNDDPRASDADSSTSSVPGGELCRSTTTTRATRYGRRSVITQPIPMHLDEDSEGSQSPAPSRRQTRAAKGKAASSVSDSQTCDSEGFESSPVVTEQRMTRSKAKAKHLAQKAAGDSESELTEFYSPQGRSGSPENSETPCSRQGSGSSGRGVRVTRLRGKAVTHSLENIEGMPAVSTPIKPRDLLRDQCQSVSEPADEGDYSEFERTVITDPDCTVLGEDTTLTLQEEDQESSVRSKEPTAADITLDETEMVEVGHQGSVMVSMTTDVMDGHTSIPPSISASQVSRDTTEKEKREAEGHVEDPINTTADLQVSLSPSVMVSDPAVTPEDQQMELSIENAGGNATEMEQNQEKSSAEPLQQRHSVTVAICEGTATDDRTEEKPVEDICDADIHADSLTAQRENPQDELPAGFAESLPDREEEMEVSISKKAWQMVGSSEVSPPPAEPDPIQAEVIKVTSSQDQKVTVESSSEQNPQNLGYFVKKSRKILLLDSSDDEDEDLDEDVEGNESSEVEEGDHEDMGVTEGKREGASSKSQVVASSVEGLFMIDTRPGEEANEQYYMDDLNEQSGLLERERVEQEDEEEFVDEEVDDDDEDAQILFSSRNPQQKELSSCIDPGLRVKELGGLYVTFDGSKSKPVSSCLEKLQDELMKKSVIHPEFEKKDAVPPYMESKKALKLKHKAERERTTGDGWFNMKAPELTQELKGDLKLLKMRGSLDPKRFYKKNDRDGFPKYFQVGTVVDNPVDFYHSRIPKKARKRTMVEELLVDAEFRHQNKKKYQQIMAEKAAHGAGKRNKKKSKFKKK